MIHTSAITKAILNLVTNVLFTANTTVHNKIH